MVKVVLAPARPPLTAFASYDVELAREDQEESIKAKYGSAD